MNTPYLVQRLKKPVNYINPFDGFGFGGLPNGGMNKETMAVLRKIMTFDYMGAAEFEWGAVSKALEVLNDAPQLATFTMDVFPSDSIATVYVICLLKDQNDVQDWINHAADGDHGRLKEHLGFKEALNGDKYADTVGWLKIEEDRRCTSPFMFFIDKQMYDDVLKLFEKVNA